MQWEMRPDQKKTRSEEQAARNEVRFREANETLGEKRQKLEEENPRR